jgi:carboxyl-terminal processing protease
VAVEMGIGMKNKYIAGIITGALCAVIICSVVFSVLYRNSQMQQIGLTKDYNSEDSGLNNLEQEDNGLGESETDAADSKQEDRLLKKMSTIKDIVSKNFLYDVNEQQYEDSILKGLMKALDDPYSCYFTAEEYKSLMEQTEGVYYGIGAYVSQSRDTNVLTITRPFKDGPADKAGIIAGDIIYKVENEVVTDLDISTVVARMRGEKGTQVLITVLRGDKMEEVEFNVTRDEIEIPTVEYKMLEDKIGYIYVLQFDKVTVDQFIKAIDDLETQGMKGLVIDIRDNGGGLYTSCVSMLERLITKDKLLVYTETKAGERDDEYSKDDDCIKVPLAVLINGNSASASEIFAGTIQDYKIGTIVGTQSFGKGIVQFLRELADGSAIKLTVSNYYTPSGDSIHKVGITPDVVVEIDDKLTGKVIITIEEDNQLQAAIKEVKKQIQ